MVGSSQYREVPVHEHIRSFVFNDCFRYSCSYHYFWQALSFYNFGVKWNKTAKVWQPFFQTQNLQGEGWRANIRLSLFLYYTTNKRHLQTAFSILPNLHYQNIHAAQQQQPGNYAHGNNHGAACIFIYLCSIIGKQMPVKNPQSKCRQNNAAVKKHAVNNHKHA